MKTLDEKLGRVLIPLITPFKDGGSIDYDKLGELVKMLLEKDYGDSIIVSGTTGEFHALTFEERIKLFEKVKETVGDKVPLVAGSGAASTQQAVALTKEAERIGYDVAMVVAPYYCKPTQKGIYEHFKTVAESIDLPILLYNIPLFTGVNIDPCTASELAKIENVLAIKEEAGINPTQTSDFVLGTPDKFVVYCGDDTMVLPVLAQGGVGVVSGGSQVIGDIMKRMIALYFEGQVKEATELHLKMHPFFKALGGRGRINPIPLLKDAISITWEDVGKPRPPLLGGDEEEKEAMRKVLEKLGKL